MPDYAFSLFQLMPLMLLRKLFDEFQFEDGSVGLDVEAGENNAKSNEPAIYDHVTVNENNFGLFASL